LLPIVERALAAGERNLVIIAGEVRDHALTMLLVNKEKGVLTPLAINAPLFGDNKRAVLEDIAVLTGGRLISEALGDRLENATLEDLGSARRVWANGKKFTITGGKGKPAAIRQRVSQLRASVAALDSDYDREQTRSRIGKLLGGVASLRIGAPSYVERAELRQRAEVAVKAVQAAVQEGVVPGGGAAYLACIPAVLRLGLTGDEGAGAEVLARALEEPTRRIVANAGLEPDPIIARLRGHPPGWGYDVLNEQIVDMAKAGIVDPLKVSRLALASAVSTAAAALTTDVLVRQKTPPLAKNP
jgi:chaperonin GroEL